MVKLRRKLAAALIITLIALALLLSYIHYINTIYTLDRANALFNRAETAGFAEQLIEYVERGRRLLPKEGNPVWWFPTDRTDFKKIQADLESILERAEILKKLPRSSEAYQQGMDDLREKLKTIQSQVAEASGYLYVSPINIFYSALWLTAFITLIHIISSRGRAEG